VTERRRQRAAVATTAWMAAVIAGAHYVCKPISPVQALVIGGHTPADMGTVALMGATGRGLGLRLLGTQNPPGRTGEIVIASALILAWRPTFGSGRDRDFTGYSA